MVRDPLRDPPPHEPASAEPRLSAHVIRRGVTWLVRTWSGRAVLAAGVVKVLAPIGALSNWSVFRVVDGLASAILLVGGLVVCARAFGAIRRRLLWRVRRKLIVSYVFIGFVPVLLVMAFFLLAGVLMFLNVSAFLVRSGFDDLIEEAVILAETSAGELERRGGQAAAQEVLAGKLTATVGRHPGVSLALVSRSGSPATDAGPLVVGSWRHLAPPEALPVWIPPSGFGGLLAFARPGTDRTDLVVRAVGLPADPMADYAVVVDLPVAGRTLERLLETTGITLGRTAVVTADGQIVELEVGRAFGSEAAVQAVPSAGDVGYTLDWVTFFDYTDWATGSSAQVSTAIQIRISDIFTRISGAQATLGSVSLGSVFLMVLGVIGGLFLIIEFVALVMGFALARSITGSVHALFIGTEKVRAGDLVHRIQVRTQDQLGHLAESFNAMTGSIDDLLKQAAEKKRLEEELRIARDIQMSLLPEGPIDLPGISVAAMCVPAREVGGDYYDFFSLADGRLGILIADVSGKGTSAAFYMAELKGLVLSLSQIYDSPRQLLIEVNRLITDNLDTRSFITMTYAVLDVRVGTLTYARAGHTPLIYVPSGDGDRSAQVLAPDGLVLGLQFEGIAEKFQALLQESTLQVGPGDVFALYTDGVTEAMNGASDFFGESRLSQLLEQHGHHSSQELQQHVLREVEAFVDGAEQHDDMTMILVKVGSLPAAADSHGSVVVAPA